jgi:hypothetical protein
MAQNDSSTDRVGVHPGRQARLARGLAVQVDGLRHAGAGRQGDGAVDGQQGRMPGVGVEVIGHEVAGAIGERTGTTGSIARHAALRAP